MSRDVNRISVRNRRNPRVGRTGPLLVERLEDRCLPAPLSFTPFPFATVKSFPVDITAGPDGNLWFTKSSDPGFSREIGFITPTGAMTEITIPSFDIPGNIAAGPDGNLWFTEEIVDSTGMHLGNSIGRITTSLVITEFPLPAGSSDLAQGITAGPDGNVWFGDGGSLGRITPNGTITVFNLSLSPNTTVGAVTTGPDGNLWVLTSDRPVTSAPTAVLTVTPSGNVKSSIPLPPAVRSSITTGPDGNLWFTGNTLGETLAPSDTIGRITPAGIVTFFNTPTPDGNAGVITTGPDGNLWFTEAIVDRIGRITPAGVITEFAGPYQTAAGPATTEPLGIVTGPDGNLWYVDFGANQIIRINLSPSPLGRYVEKLYLDMLHRDADPAGLAHFTSLLNQGMPRTEVVLDIESSLEYRTQEVEHLYQSLLGRSADAGGLNFFVTYLAAGHSVADVKVQIFGSPEYFGRAGATSTGYLIALYHDVLGRAVDTSGQAAFSAILNRGFSTGVVAFFVVHSSEARQDLVEGFYEQCLQRQADPLGMAAFTSRRPGGYPDEDILAAILGSDEYFALVARSSSGR